MVEGHLQLCPEHLRVGQTCAAFMQQWTRAEIIDVTDIQMHQVKVVREPFSLPQTTNFFRYFHVFFSGVLFGQVFFVDYGSVQTIDVSLLRWLPSPLTERPRYARRGCLDQVVPLRSKWPMETMMYFYQLIGNRIIHGRPTFVCERVRARVAGELLFSFNAQYICFLSFCLQSSATSGVFEDDRQSPRRLCECEQSIGGHGLCTVYRGNGELWAICSWDRCSRVIQKTAERAQVGTTDWAFVAICRSYLTEHLKCGCAASVRSLSDQPSSIFWFIFRDDWLLPTLTGHSVVIPLQAATLTERHRSEVNPT